MPSETVAPAQALEQAMPRIVKTINTARPGYARDLAAAIQEYQPSIACFDYFDTVVTRSVHPEDVKRIACERLARVLGTPSEGALLYQKRSELEAALCRENEASGGDLEFNIRLLMAALWNAMPQCRRIDLRRFVDLAVDVEISIECAVQIPDADVVRVLRDLRAEKRDCWLVSDFYMSGDDLIRVLRFHGIHELFSKVFVSADTYLTKRSGRLYPVVVGHARLPAHELLMVGDNPHSDAESARRNGVAAIHLDREHQHHHYGMLSARSNDQELAEAQILKLLDGAGFVFCELALTLHAFVDRLYHSLLGAGARDVYFLAREGQLLKRLFDTYQEARKPPPNACIRTHYIEVSRRSTFLPSLRSLTEETFETLFRQYRHISIDEFLSSLGLDDLQPELATEFQFDLTARQKDLPTSEAFATLLANPRFRDTYERERRVRRDAFRAYLESFPAADPSADIHIVDVGWKGTIQDNIRNIFDQIGGKYSGRTIYGHYLGMVAAGSSNERNVKTGLLFSLVGGVSKNIHVYNENRALFEVALGADHGSAQSYRLSVEGNPEVLRHEFSEEILYRSKVLPLQQGLERIFGAIDTILRHHIYPHARLEAFVARQHARMVFKPTRAEVEWFEDAFHTENFGVFELSRFHSVTRGPSLLDKAKFYLTLRSDPDSLNLGFWPWLACRRQGGRLVAARYGTAKIGHIKD